MSTWMNARGEDILNLDYIAANVDKVDWEFISRCSGLSKEFIAKYQDKIYWECISEFEKLSEEFIKKYIYLLSVDLQGWKLSFCRVIICYIYVFM
jgi:hypothetical protein